MRTDVDAVAARLQLLGDTMRAMPPAWAGAGIHQPVLGFGGEVLGRCLPGRGLYLDMDTKYLGITRPIPNVVERSVMRRVADTVERLCEEKGAITSMAAIKTAIANGQGQNWPWVCPGSGLGNALWTIPSRGGFYSGGNANFPSPGAVMDQTNTIFSINPGMFAPNGSNTLILASFGWGQTGATTSPQAPFIVLIDQLVGAGSVDATQITPQPVVMPALTRYTGGAGVLIFTSQDGVTGVASAGTVTVGYTNQAGAVGQSTPALAMSSNVLRTVNMVKDAAGLLNNFPWCQFGGGDFGAQTVSSITLSVAQGAGTTVGAMLYYPLSWFVTSQAQQDYQEYDLTASIEGLVQLQVSSGKIGCLGIMIPGNSLGSDYFGTLKTVQG